MTNSISSSPQRRSANFALKNVQRFAPLAMLVAFSCVSTHSNATDPFDSCPSKAYLFQSKPVQVYGLNLVTGTSTLLQGDTGTSANINGVGFDFNSRYIYGYDTTNKQLVRLGKDFKVQNLNTSGLPSEYTFFVGDVFDGTYYLYRKGEGLFSVDLSPLDNDPSSTLTVNKVSSIASITLTDMAFHPNNENLYGVDNKSGKLYEINPSDGTTTEVGDTGVTGTFGAGYFDVNGNYYLSRNSDGAVFRIDLSSEFEIAQGNVAAVKFADGPASGQNDGARCANAPLIDEDSNIDFGDAPDSYATKLMSNGPRHQLDGVTYLGASTPDGEQDGFSSPLSDETVGINDDDGVNFVTSIEPGLDSIVVVEASTSGYLSAWVDWNQDGDFDDEGEQVFSDVALDAGRQSLFFTPDVQALNGNTWSRFRFSQQQNLSYDGGAMSGEVEDHQLTVTGSSISVRYFPSQSNYATLAYEDNWPYIADYDMNDVVMHLKVTEIIKDQQVAKAVITGRLAAVGADYHNGFAVRLPGLLASDIDTATTRMYHNGELQADSGLEQDSKEAIFIINNDVTAQKTPSCQYHRTLKSCLENEAFAFELHVNIKEGSDASALAAMPYDPFIFATPGYYHGEGLPNHPGRSWEVHLPDQAPTEKFDQQALWHLGVDASDPQNGVYFKTATNLPWALLMTEEWQWPIERVELLDAYPQFAEFAETGGKEKPFWHRRSNARQSKIYP